MKFHDLFVRSRCHQSII